MNALTELFESGTTEDGLCVDRLKRKPQPAVANSGDWDEAEHPRAEDGKFAAGDSRQGYPESPKLPDREEGGKDIFRVYSERKDRWEEQVKEWLKSKPQSKAIVWQEPDWGTGERRGPGNVKLLSRNIGDPANPWRITTFIPHKGRFMPAGHQVYPTREKAMIEEGEHVGRFHEEFPGEIMTEKEIQGYKLMDEIVDKSKLVWYDYNGSVPELEQRIRGTGYMSSYVKDGSRNGRLAFTEALKPEHTEWLGLKRREAANADPNCGTGAGGFQPGNTCAARERVDSAASRFRPREVVEFSPHLTGPSGAKLKAYEWKWMPEAYVDNRGEDRVRRVSDWDAAVESADTGRGLVHHYHVETPDGKTQVVSSESVVKALGYETPAAVAGSRLPSLVSASKTLAKLRMKHAVLKGRADAWDAAEKQAKQEPMPEIVHKGSVYYKYGDMAGKLRGHEFGTKNWTYGYMFEPHVDSVDKITYGDRREQIEDNYRFHRSGQIYDQQHGGPRPLGLELRDVERRLKRQEAKVKAITEAKTDSAANEIARDWANKEGVECGESWISSDKVCRIGSATEAVALKEKATDYADALAKWKARMSGGLMPTPVQEATHQEPPPAETMIEPNKHPVVEFPIEKIKLSKDVPNFKTEADPVTGVVAGNRLEGKYERLGTAPIVLWERNNGDIEVITGRHRLDLARRTGETTIPSQVVREKDGFSQAHALTFDAESNIRDGQGDVEDYAHYFKHSPNLTAEKAGARGLLSRVKGKAGWDLGRNASDDVYAAWADEKINTDRAVAVARSAPGDANLQAMGLKQALKGRSPAEIENFVKAVQAETKGGHAEELDMFGRSDAALNKAEEMATRASRIQGGILDQIRAVNSAAKRPEAAAKLGVDVRDPQGVLKRVGELRQELARWGSWPQHPDLVARVREAANEGGQQCGDGWIAADKTCRVGGGAQHAPANFAKVPVRMLEARINSPSFQAAFAGSGGPLVDLEREFGSLDTLKGQIQKAKGDELAAYELVQRLGRLPEKSQRALTGKTRLEWGMWDNDKRHGFALDTPESIGDQQARQAREAAAAAHRKQQEELAKRSQKRLVGDLGSAGQFDMFGGATPQKELFAHERVGISGVVWRLKRWLGNAGKPCGDSYIPADYDCHKGEAAAPEPKHQSLEAAVAHLKDTSSAEEYAKAIRATAEQADAATTPRLQKLVEENGGEMHGLDNRLKTVESLTRKLPMKAEKKGITVKEYSGKLGDALRYTAVLPVNRYTAGVRRVMAALERDGFKFTDKEQKWANTDYKGLHFNLVTPQGLTTELQFHTPESIATKKPSHKIFEEMRVSKDPSVLKRCKARLMKLWRGVTVPQGVFSI